MARCRLLIFVIILEVLQVAYCVSGNDSFNPFSPMLNKKSELRASILPDEKELFFQSNEDPEDEKVIEKRRLFFKDGEINSAGLGERENLYDDFPSRRKTNYSEIETAVQIPEQKEGHNNWDNRQNRISIPVAVGERNFPEFQSRQPWMEQQHPNQQFNWEERNNVYEKTQSRWNEEKNFRQFENSGFHPREGNTYNGRPAEMYQDSFNTNPVRNGDVFNRKMSITSLNEPKNYNDRVGEMNPSYMGNPNMNFYNRNPKGFWNPRVYRPDKGVIINFNTECPTPRQFNNQLVHKFIYTQKPPLNVDDDIDFLVPESSIIAAHKMTPMYFL